MQQSSYLREASDMSPVVASKGDERSNFRHTFWRWPSSYSLDFLRIRRHSLVRDDTAKELDLPGKDHTVARLEFEVGGSKSVEDCLESFDVIIERFAENNQIVEVTQTNLPGQTSQGHIH